MILDAYGEGTVQFVGYPHETAEGLYNALKYGLDSTIKEHLKKSSSPEDLKEALEKKVIDFRKRLKENAIQYAITAFAVILKSWIYYHTPYIVITTGGAVVLKYHEDPMQSVQLFHTAITANVRNGAVFLSTIVNSLLSAIHFVQGPQCFQPSVQSQPEMFNFEDISEENGPTCAYIIYTPKKCVSSITNTHTSNILI